MAPADASNIDAAVVAGFGREWQRFDQPPLTRRDS